MNHAEEVKQFTESAKGKECPKTPIEMNRAAVLFIIRMVMSELDELASTVTEDEIDREMLMREALVKRDKCKEYEYPDNTSKIAAQSDALVDAMYYMFDTGAKHGVNLSKIFEIVHVANMAKVALKSAEIRKSDGKVEKPKEGWNPPDVKGEIMRQMREGSWK